MICRVFLPPLKKRDLRDVPDFAGVLVFVELEMLEVFLERVADDDLAVQNFLELHMARQRGQKSLPETKATYNWCDFRVARSVLQILRFYPCNPLPIVDHFRPGLDEGVKDDVAVEVHDGNAGQPVAFLRQDAFAVQSQDLCFSIGREEKG